MWPRGCLQGCQLDAVKLFVGNLSKIFTEDMLFPVFARFGTVVELVVVCTPYSSLRPACGS